MDTDSLQGTRVVKCRVCGAEITQREPYDESAMNRHFKSCHWREWEKIRAWAERSSLGGLDAGQGISGVNTINGNHNRRNPRDGQERQTKFRFNLWDPLPDGEEDYVPDRGSED